MGVASSVVISRLGGAEVKGVTSAFAALTILAFTVVNLDLAQQTLRHGRSTNSLNSIRARLIALWPWYLLLTALVAGGGLLLGRPHLTWLAAGTFCYLVAAQMGIACTGLSGPAATAIGGILQQAGMVSATLTLAAIGCLNTSWAPLVVILSFLAPLPWYLWAARPRRAHMRSVAGHDIGVLGLIRAGVKWQAARIAQLLLLRLDTLCVFWFLGASDAGVYSVGLATSALAGMVPAQFASNVIHEATLGRRASLRRNVRSAALAGSIGGLALIAGGWPLLLVAYGREFERSYIVLLGTLPGVVAYGVLQVFTNQMRIVGQARSVTIPSAVGVLVMVACLAAAAPGLGIAGAALASSAGALAAVGTAYVLWREQPVPRTRAAAIPRDGLEGAQRGAEG
jgi:O-antigen/teichoic acid export membrane protein